MTTPRFSSDPEQQAEMVAQWHFENRLLGINPYRAGPKDEDYADYESMFDLDEPDWDDQDDDGQPDEAQEWHDFDPDDYESMFDQDDDGQPDEAQEWHDFDPDC